MKYLFIPLILVSIFSCKKENPNNLSNSSWTTYYKSNGFNFYASTNMQLKTNGNCLDIGLIDTIEGNWQYSGDFLNIQFENNTIIKATFINNDSLSGTMQNAGINGIWTAKRN